MASSKATSALERRCGWTQAVSAIAVLAVFGVAMLLFSTHAWAKSLPVIELPADQSQADNWDSLARGGMVLFYDDMEHGTNGWTTFDHWGSGSGHWVPHFHVDTYMAYSGGHSWWCGTFDYDANGGYGNSWDQRLDLPPIDMTGYAQPILQFNYRHDSELDYDYTYVEAMNGGGYTTLGAFTGVGSWQLSSSYSLAGFNNPGRIRFRFVSDWGMSDEDREGGFDSNGGAFMCDNIKVFDGTTGTVLFYDDCESGGRCTPSVPAAGGDYWHIINRACWATTRPHSWWCGSDADTTHIPAYVLNSLFSPPIDVSGLAAGTPCVLSFRAKLQTGSGDYAQFFISNDGGLTWINAFGGGAWTGTSSCGSQGGYLSLSATPYLPASSLRFRAMFQTDGDGCGPGPYNGAGLIVDDVRLVAWPPPLTQNVVCDPDPQYLTATNPVQRVAVDYVGGGSGLLYGYSVKFTWDGTKVSTAPNKVGQGRLLYYYGSHGWTQRFFRARSTGANEITVDSMLLGDEPGVAGPGTMFTVDFTGLSVGTSPIDVTVLEVRDRDNNLLTGFAEDDGQLIVDVQKPVISSVFISNETLAHTDDYIKNGDLAKLTATVADDDPAFAAANIKANLTSLGRGAAVSPDSYNPVTDEAVWNAWAVSCTPADGTVTVTVGATDAIGNVALQGSDTIIADNTKPTVVTGFDAAPGHQKCELAWTNGTDTYLAGVTVRRLGNGEYPQYPLFRAAWPAVDAHYPASQTAGTEVYNGTGASATDAVTARDIYYYQAFCYDIARNYSVAAATARDLSTNYWLGDVAVGLGVWGYNGLVNAADIDKLGGQYGTTNPVSPWDECDVGPTVHPTGNRLGLPNPDRIIQFEDAMIFAMNYWAVAPRIVPFLPAPEDEMLALSLEELATTPEGEVTVALRLEGNVGEVKGISTVITFDPSQLEFVAARLSDAMVSPLADVFFWHGGQDGKALVDLAVLGTGAAIGGSGGVAVLTFRALSEDYALAFEQGTLRGVENEDLTAELQGLESKPEMPTVFRLAQNVPNPFNPVTVVKYEVPFESSVTIQVYDVAGREVRTLLDGVVPPGRHQVVWDGRNDAGESVGSGVYFCVMEAPDYHASKKMMLLK